MNWSFYSSDMNSIEHFWFLFKEKMYDVCSDIEKADDNNGKVRKTLFEALFKTWEQLNGYYLHDLMWSMKKRIKALITSEEWYIKY